MPTVLCCFHGLFWERVFDFTPGHLGCFVLREGAEAAFVLYSGLATPRHCFCWSFGVDTWKTEALRPKMHLVFWG